MATVSDDLGPRLSVRCAQDPDLQLECERTGLGYISRFRYFLMRVILSQQFEMFAGCVILCNFIVIGMETNARVEQDEASEDSQQYQDAAHRLAIQGHINSAFLVFYSIECALRLFIQGRAFFKHKWNLFDLIIVCVGILGEMAEGLLLGSMSSTSMEHFQILRSMRMLRLLRAARVIISFKELYSLICGLSSCLKTLFWAAGLVFLLLTMWSILSVEYLHPLIRKLAEDGHYTDCSYCPNAFRDIMNANLTLFQIVSGDGWTELSRPLIARHPWTVVIIVCIIFTMVFGMLNLITAVIVDTAAQAREADIMHMAKHKEFERAEAWANFASLCERLDENQDGEISLEELRKGIGEIPELGAHLSVLGVEEDDLQMVFDILDLNQDGRITHQEFIRQLYKIHTYELRSAHCFMKHYVEDIRKHVKLLWNKSSEGHLSTCLDEEDQPEPELYPRSPPQDAVGLAVPSTDAPSILSTDCDQESLEVRSFDPSWNDEPAASCQGELAAEEVSGMQFSGCRYFDVSSPVHDNDGTFERALVFEDLNSWADSCTSLDQSVHASSLRSLSKQRGRPLKKDSLQDLQEDEVSVDDASWNSDAEGSIVPCPQFHRYVSMEKHEACGAQSQHGSNVDLQDLQNDAGFELPGLLKEQPDLECGGGGQQSTLSGSRFHVI